MAVTLFTEDQLFAAVMAYFRLAFPGVDLSDRSFFGLLARSFSRFFALAQYQVLQVDNDRVPAYQQDADGNVRSRCSSEALDAWAYVFGLASGVPGVYGRRGATISTGGAGIPTVSAAAVLVPAGTQATDPTGQIIVQTTTTTTLNGPPNNIPLGFVSITTGTQANLPVGTLLTWTAPPAGLSATVVLTSALIDAEDVETDSELVARILQRIQQPPRGGTAADYRFWAEESADANGALLDIFRAFVYPLRSGLGSVDLVATLRGSGTGRKPPAATIASVQAFVDKLRPVTATVNVFPPYMPTALALRIAVKVEPSPAKNGTYGWDWRDFGATGITAHTSNSVTVVLVPAGLVAAFVLGGQPRIQVIISTAGGSVLPFVARVTNITGTTLTLDTPFVTQPTDGVDYFYAGSSVVIPVATRLLSYIDSLGPSRQSGFADPNDAWQDQVLLEAITDIVMETRDTDGTKMVYSMPGFVGNLAAQIAIGTGTFNPVEYTTRDVGIAVGPELAYLRVGGIEVQQG